MRKTALFLASICFILLIFQQNFGDDNVPPSQSPPGGLSADEVPQFVMIGFDDNPDYEPMQWIVDFLKDKKNPEGIGNKMTYDGTPARVSFYSNSMYLDESSQLRDVHLEAYNDGHEIGNHTKNHHHGNEFSESQWEPEVVECNTGIVNCGIPEDDIFGFRSPFLEHNDNVFTVISSLDITYDCTIEEGFQYDQDGTDFMWPYTLDGGSPGNELLVEWGTKKPIEEHPGLWEVPNHCIFIPPDNLCEEYGATTGLRERVKAAIKQNEDWDWDAESGKITGFDYNLCTSASMKANELLATLEYTLDLRYDGNRAPFMFGAHSADYPSSKPELREAIEDYIEFALDKDDVRIVPPIKIIEWCRDPVSLEETEVIYTAEKNMKEPLIKCVTANRIDLTIREAGIYNISLYSIDGKKIRNISRQFFNSNNHSIHWNKKNLSTKVYFIRVDGRNRKALKKVFVVSGK